MRERERVDLAGAAARGLVAGAAGTAAMTVYQELVSRLKRGEDGDEASTNERHSWDEAPAPAQVARKALRVVGVDPSPDRIPLLTNVMHWAYGTAWGAAYGLLRSRVRINAPAAGTAFGTAVWAASYAELVPIGLYDPPWEYPLETVAADLSYHLIYGFGVAAAYSGLERQRLTLRGSTRPAQRPRARAVRQAGRRAWSPARC